MNRSGWKIGLCALAFLLAVSGWFGGPFDGASVASAAASGSAIGQDIDGHWAEASLRQAVEDGWLTGDENGKVAPDRRITRAELMALANRAFGLKDTAEVSFSDVPQAAWYAPEVAIAVKAGYVSGYPDGTARPNEQVTRQETAAMLAGLTQKLLGAEAAKGEGVSFTDGADIGNWSAEAVKTLAGLAILKGFPDGTFRPNSPITRAEAVVALARLKALAAKPESEPDKPTVYGQAGTYGPDSGSEVISGDAMIQTGGVTLRNVTIKGDLTLTKEVGEGDVTLENVKVEGDTLVNGGGANSVHLIDSVIASLIVSKEGGEVRIVAQGTTQISQAEFRSVAVFVVESGAKVETLTVHAIVKVTGQGIIVTARLYVSGSTLELRPQNIEAAEGIEYFSGVVSSGGSGSGGGPKPDPAPVVTGVANGAHYAVAVTPRSSDKDIASVELRKDEAVVDGYELGDEIVENGSYVLTVTDKGGHVATVSFTLELPVQLIPELDSIGMDDTMLNLNVHVTNTGETIDNVINGVRVTVPNYDGDEIYGSYNDGYDSFYLERAGSSDDFIGYFPEHYVYGTGMVNDPYPLIGGWDTSVGYGLDLGHFTEAQTVKVHVWIADADQPEESHALYRMRELRIPLEANYVGPIDDLEVISVAEGYAQVRFTYPTDAREIYIGYGASIPGEDSFWDHYKDAYLEDAVTDSVTGKVTLELWLSFATSDPYYLQMTVYGGKYDGQSNIIHVESAPEIPDPQA
ncbi:S-layer homology domain-containing protein [Cohnella sp. AR92]|uniref:S-layer homology domain-containing protein n=1 Tax=Cohnella sp. AR92 TaxID=648716 RepID=UPI0013155092|nr:S-layer homology domain-containing protein [Cohnella sp. AR92]